LKPQQLIQLGLPSALVPDAIAGIRAATQAKRPDFSPQNLLQELVAQPERFTADPQFSQLAIALLDFQASRNAAHSWKYATWGQSLDPQSLAQMDSACDLPVARAGALRPDAHLGYGLPIGGVLACENAVVPYAVGVDIACRMRLTVTDLDLKRIDENTSKACREMDRSLEQGTRFGKGQQWEKPHTHAVLDEDWGITQVTADLHDRAARQLGTSGSGNHFVEWGIVEFVEPDLGLEAGRYVALMSHSGSRGAGAKVCQHFSQRAKQHLPQPYRGDPNMQHLAWLSLDSEDGQAYWQAMSLMGRYAAANHEVIHRNVLRLAGAQSLVSVENHHNFAWKETHGENEWIVHRKGATPAGQGVLGVIPGSMADPAFIVRGKGNAASLRSASHGAGRRMSRTKAKREFNWKTWQDTLKQRQVRLLAGGLDEVPGAYKNIHEVMAAQEDLVETVARFDPKIVMMCADGSQPED
jgi:tRNA-splicing ligase RtcB